MEKRPQTWAQFDGDKVLTWRATELHRAGFTEQQAAWLAECKSVDLHYAAKLLAQGLTKGSSRETIFDLLAE